MLQAWSSNTRAIRTELAQLKDDTSEIKMRLTSIDERLTLAEKGIANVTGDLAIVQIRLDKQGDRLERIEKRLELTRPDYPRLKQKALDRGLWYKSPRSRAVVARPEPALRLKSPIAANNASRACSASVRIF